MADYKKAQELFAHHEYEAAKSLYENLLHNSIQSTQQPEYFNSYFNLGICYTKQFDKEKNKKYLEQAITCFASAINSVKTLFDINSADATKKIQQCLERYYDK